MRLSELSRVTGVPAATIKWYLRVGLLPRGTATAPNQASYDDGHVRRLRLVRALLDVGGLSVEAAREVVAAIDDPAREVHDVLGAAHGALAKRGTPPPAALSMVDTYLAGRGWQVAPDSPTRAELALVLAAIGTTADAPPVDHAAAVAALLDPYADAADQLAASEVASARPDLPRDQLVGRVVAGTVFMERALAALRRLAQEHHSATRYAP